MCQEKKSGGSAKWLHRVSLIFRVAGIALAVAAEGIMLTASQCTVYADYGVRPRTITYRDFHEFVYLVAATPIATLLEVVAVFLSVSKKRRSKKAARVLLPFLAFLVPELLSTSASTAIDAGWEVSYYLEHSGRRVSLCRSRIGAHFCAQVHVSMWLELGAAVAVSAAEILSMWRWCHGSDSCSDSGSDSESDSESVCGHGCHCRH